MIEHYLALKRNKLSSHEKITEEFYMYTTKWKKLILKGQSYTALFQLYDIL